MIDNNKYHLQEYTGSSSRHECPKCHHQAEFTYYVDDNGQMIDVSVGRCNRVDSCGYHLTPREWFTNHPSTDSLIISRKPVKEERTCYLPDSLLTEDTHRKENNLYRYLITLFDEAEVNKVFDLYHVGTSKHWRNNGGLSCSFPQIDNNGRVSQVKVMAYNPTSGHRLHKQHRAEIWNGKTSSYLPTNELNGDKVWFAGKSILKDYNSNLIQTFFGCHLIGGADRIGLVESEKTALICSILIPSITWVATGGCNGCKWTDTSVFEPLIGKRVVLYPDAGMFVKWKNNADILRFEGVNVTISSRCEQEESNTDIADVLIRELHKSRPAKLFDFLTFAQEEGINTERITINL